MHFYLLRPWQPTNQDWCRQPGEFNSSGLRAACKQAVGWNILSSMGISDRWGGGKYNSIEHYYEFDRHVWTPAEVRKRTINLLQWKNDYKGDKERINTSGFHFQQEEKRVGDRFESLERARDWAWDIHPVKSVTGMKRGKWMQQIWSATPPQHTHTHKMPNVSER